jgi:prepilin-type N-terminal cleavage/methylation domain-containing protein
MQSEKPLVRQRRGFTLIEAVITVLIVAMGCIGALSLIQFLRLQNVLAQERARAHQIVCEEMDRQRHELFPQITGGTTVTVWDNGTPDDPTDDTMGTIEVIVRDTDGNLLPAVVGNRRVQVEVTLTWNPRGRLSNKTYHETVMTYIAPT